MVGLVVGFEIHLGCVQQIPASAACPDAAANSQSSTGVLNLTAVGDCE